MKHLTLVLLLLGCVHPEEVKIPPTVSSLKFEAGQCVMILDPQMESSDVILRVEDIISQSPEYGDSLYRYRWWLGPNQMWAYESSINLSTQLIDKLGKATPCPECPRFACCQAETFGCNFCRQKQQSCTWSPPSENDLREDK